MTRRQRPTILVLDDDAEILDLMRDMIGVVGEFDVITESDARRALLLLGERNPDLLVCDLSMPGMDGIEFLNEAAASRYRGAVILLSGMDSGVRLAAQTLANVQGLRVVAAFRKPVELADLRSALASLG